MVLLNSQKLLLWEILQKEGLDPSRFDYGTVNRYEGEVGVVYAVGSPDVSFDILDTGSGPASVEYSPATESYRSGPVSVHSGFENVMRHFMLWCEAIRREEAAVDPWEAKRQLEELIQEDEDGSDDDSLYSVDEQRSIENMLRAIEANFERRLDETGQEVGELKLYVARQFEYLRQDVATKGRRTWRTMFRDFMVNISATLSVQLGQGLMHDFVVIANEGMRAIG